MSFPIPPAILANHDVRAADIEKTPAEAHLRMFAWMTLSRLTDNRILDLFRQGLIKGTVTGGQGHEGLIVPLALLAQKDTDVISFSHRGLGGHLIWGGHLCEHLNQYFANAGSPTHAREGNVHHGDPAHRSLPMISHLGSMCSHVLGMTDSQRRQNRAAVGFTFFGDGASSTGDIHESLNLAAVLSLPIVFVIENNRYAYSTPVSEQFSANIELWQRAAGYGIEGFRLDCTDPKTALTTLCSAIEKARSQSRPVLIEAQVLRLRGHAAYDTCDYLKPGESDSFFAADPLPHFRAQLVAEHGEARLAAIESELAAFIEACVAQSLATPRPTAAGMEQSLFAAPGAALDWVPSLDSKPGSAAESLTMAQAINRALRKVLTERPESLVLGQDIATYGGAFKITDGLLASFGRSRVFNAPVAESACTGYTIGMALNGHRPIEEFQFADFVTDATTQICLNAATYHFRAGAKVPAVFRLPCGGGLTFGSFHSQELEAMLLSFPGLKALYPSTPQDAFNAILAAYEDDNPTLVFEHKALYRRGKQSVSWDANFRDIWRPRRVRSGDFATVVTYGEMVHLSEEACDYFAGEYERTFDLWDLRALSPLQLDEIEASLARTHRLIVIHEGRRTHGFGAELVSRLTEKRFHSLEAAPLRIASLDLPVPFAPELEHVYRPTRDKAIEQIAAWMG